MMGNWTLFNLVTGRQRLARYAVAEVDDSRAEGAGLDEFEIHPALALGKERNATASQHRVDPGPVLVRSGPTRPVGADNPVTTADLATFLFGRVGNRARRRPPNCERAGQLSAGMEDGRGRGVELEVTDGV
jgi:hypothetical protein